MGRKRVAIAAADIHGCKYFKLIPELLKSLHDVGTARDKSGNREFFCDQYVSLLLLYFFSPVVSQSQRPAASHGARQGAEAAGHQACLDGDAQ
jgi:hypothetical protein|tara:strand:- start:996 stop:1274 length:279 start_codon:yes stop_codon:yes gene_type:complete